MMTLYGYYRSSAAFRVRIALALKGVDYANEAVNLAPPVSAQKSADYRAINPQGRVPFLQDGDTGISQSPAILEYLEERFPEPALLPSEPAARAQVRQMAALIGCDVHPLNNLSVLVYLKKTLGLAEDAVNAWYAHWIVEGFTALEEMVQPYAGRGPFCFGAEATMADVYLVPQMWNARRFKVDVSAFPRLVAIDAHCQTVEAFKVAAPENQPDAPSDG